MAQDIVILQKCPHCAGDGKKGSISCNWLDCNGTGYITLGYYTADPGLVDIYNEALNAKVLAGDASVVANAIKVKTDNLPASTSDKLDDITDKLNDIMDKLNDILESIND